MLDLLVTIASWACLIVGGIFVVTGTAGLLRFPEFYTRLHAASLPDTLGMMLIVTGLILQAGWSQVSIKLFAIVVFMLLTGPTATHALAKAARRGNVHPQLAEPETGKD